MNVRFAQKLEDLRRLIDGSASFLLAVSGGMDSMCMADLFLQSCGADSFAIAHCNFSLRGQESDGDEALVREWAERNGVSVFVKHFDTVSYAREKGISIEMAARELRYSWFAELCREHGFVAVSVAHNANDNAETLFLNLLRGTGLKGLHGMAELMMQPVGLQCGGEDMPPPARGCPSVARTGVFGATCSQQTVLIFRPLLEYTRKQIEGYVISHRVPYRHDSSNFTSDYKRNKIRNEVFPVFEKINPSFVRTLNREIGYFAEAGEIVEDWCEAHVGDVLITSSEKILHSVQNDIEEHLRIDTAALLATPHWRYLLYYMLEPYGFNSQTLASVESLLISERTVSGKRFESPTHVLLTGRNELTLLPSFQLGVNETYDHSALVEVIRTPGTYNFNGIRFKVEQIPWSADMPLKQPQGTLIMDASKMRFPFVCRRWRQGDWLVPLGMRGRKKVSDLFTDLKYDTLEKESAIMLVDTMAENLAEQQHIAGVLGVRIDDRYKITPLTKNVIRISVTNI